MKPLLKVLGSSSAGNCGLLSYQNKHYLIDVGFSCKRTVKLLEQQALKLEDLSGVFITHEHQDHTLGLRVLHKKTQLPLYANRRTAEAIERKYGLKARWILFETGKTFFIPGLAIKAFSVPHDAADPVGYFFKTHNYSCVWATDIGYITDELSELLIEAQDIVFESNHDETLLMNHPTRPLYLKQRILGPLGHLSNHSAFEFFRSHRSPWKSICLAHLSQECNSCALVQKLFQPLAQEYGFQLTVIDPKD